MATIKRNTAVIKLLTRSSLKIFNTPVGEKKKCLKLSLNWSGTRARPSARFWMAAFSTSLLGSWVGVLEVAPCGALDAKFLGCADGPEREGVPGAAAARGRAGAEREGVPGAAAAPGRAGRCCCCMLPVGVLVGPGAWLALPF